jgi:hypothetical protein
MADPPRPSPRPRVDRPDVGLDEPKTDPGLQAALQRHDWKLTVRSIIIAGGTLITGIVSVFVFIDNRVAAQTDAGVKVHEERISTLEQQRKEDRAELDARLKRIEANANADHELTLGTSQKVDKLLERFNVPNPAPAPKDGGR